MRSFRSYIVSLMKDERARGADKAVKALLRLLSGLYALGVRSADWQYRSGMRSQRKVPVPVVSVGNITAGGTGKTPFTIYLADRFLSAGRKPAILIRGYGDDEHRMLAHELPDVPVFVGQDRVRSANAAVKKGLDVVILDDGFQHRRIRRDLDILLLDSAAPVGNGLLLPRGILREPVTSLKRADLIILTKSDRITREQKQGLIKRLSVLAPGVPVAVSRHKPVFFTDVTQKTYSPEYLSGKSICLVSGIADPDYFAWTIRGLGGVVADRLDLADHHVYQQSDVDRISARCLNDRIDAVAVTGKDYIKMRDLDLSAIEEKLFILHIAIEILEGEEEIIAGLDSSVPC